MNRMISKRIYLEPKYLDTNIMEHLYNKAKKSLVGKCFKEYGHILSLGNIINCDNIENTIFNVTFEAETLKPTINDNFIGIVCMVYKDGIFVSISKKQQMLIPSTSLNDYIFDSEYNIYINNIGEKIKEGDSINTKVTAVEFNKNNFSCIGMLEK